MTDGRWPCPVRDATGEPCALPMAHGGQHATRAELDSAPVQVWSYPGRTQADAGERFSQHARDLGARGYQPTAQSWGEGRPGAGRVLALGELSTAVRPAGFLTVTYQLRQATAPAEDPIEMLRRLAGLRDAGIVTPAEFEAKKAEVLARL